MHFFDLLDYINNFNLKFGSVLVYNIIRKTHHHQGAKKNKNNINKKYSAAQVKVLKVSIEKKLILNDIIKLN